MNNVKNLLDLEENSINSKLFFVLMLIAFTFSIAVRMIWVEQFSGVEQFKWNNELMINTNDGYYYAEGAKDNLLGIHQENDRSPVDSPLSQLTSFLAYIIPSSFEALILYMPAFFGSLLVIPIMLIARLIKQDSIGFIAALSGSIAWSYYNRTMTGYYDTDMLVIVLPTLVLYSVILATISQRNRYLILITLSMMLNTWWYPSAYSINMGMIAIIIGYTLFFERKNIYFYKILIFMGISVLLVPFWMKIVLALLIFSFFHFKSVEDYRIVLSILGATVIGLLVTGGFTPIIDRLETYILRTSISSNTVTGLHYFNVVQTVREAGQIPFETFANRISGHTITFLLSTIGYILLALRYRVMWLALPMIGLGFLALQGGLRFTVYAVPINALGLGFLIVFMSQKFPKNLRYIFMTLTTVAVLYPNVSHVIGYRVPTVLNKHETKVLDALHKISSREDYVLAWWDYGYPIRYYADVKTLIDGGAHSGNANYPVSFSLLEPQDLSSSMARLAVEYRESTYKDKRTGLYMELMMDDSNMTTPSDFLLSLSQDLITLPKKTRDIYYYLPLRMLNIFPTVSLFSNLDLSTGKAYKAPFFFQTTNFRQNGNEIDLSRGVRVDLKNGNLILPSQSVPINTFYTTEYDGNGKLVVSAQTINIQSEINVVYMKSMNRFLVLDKKMLDSTYIQLFVFQNYDRNLFELSISSPYAKVYKLKI